MELFSRSLTAFERTVRVVAVLVRYDALRNRSIERSAARRYLFTYPPRSLTAFERTVRVVMSSFDMTIFF